MIPALGISTQFFAELHIHFWNNLCGWRLIDICNQDIEIEFKESGKNMPLSVEETTDQLRDEGASRRDSQTLQGKVMEVFKRWCQTRIRSDMSAAKA